MCILVFDEPMVDLHFYFFCTPIRDQNLQTDTIILEKVVRCIPGNFITLKLIQCARRDDCDEAHYKVRVSAPTDVHTEGYHDDIQIGALKYCLLTLYSVNHGIFSATCNIFMYSNEINNYLVNGIENN